MQTLKHNPFVYTILSLCILIPFSNTHAEDCNELIRLGIYNVYNTISEHDSLVTAYHQLCTEDIDKVSTEKKRGMSLAFEFLKIKIGPISGNYDTTLTTDTQRKYCETIDTSNKLRTYDSVQSQQIYDGSLNAWQNCLAMQARGLKTDIRPTSTFSAVSFDLYWTGSVGAKFRGIDQPDLGKSNCIVTTTSGNKTVTQVVKSDTQFPLTTKASNFVCNRTIKTEIDGTKYSDAMRLTIKTSDGSFDIDMPPLGFRRVSIPEINGLYNEVADLKTRLVTAETANNSQGEQLANQVTQIASLNTATKWIFAWTCPQGWTNGGSIGFIANPYIQNLGIGLGVSYYENSWYWVHPQICHRPV